MSELHYTVYGEGPPLVLVHGLGGSTRWWRRNSRELSQHFKLYLIDLPGFGGSGTPGSLEVVTASLPAWLDWIGLDRVHVVGHSMGGYVAMHLAACHPERVRRLALIDSVGIPLNTSIHHMVGRLASALRHGSFTFMPTIVSDGLRAGIPSLLRLTGEIVEVDGRPLMEKIQAPTLLLWGTRDVILPPRLGMEMAERIPHATFHFIPRAGHNAMADRPRLVNRFLVDFLCQEEGHDPPIAPAK